MSKKNVNCIDWETIDHYEKWIDNPVSTRCYIFGRLWRTPTPEGWLVKNQHGSMVFVPDQNHEWQVNKKEMFQNI